MLVRKFKFTFLVFIRPLAFLIIPCTKIVRFLVKNYKWLPDGMLKVELLKCENLCKKLYEVYANIFINMVR